MARQEIQRILKECEFFRDLEEIDLEKIAALCQVVTYEAGEYIFCQGDLGNHLYVIAEGQVFLERATDLGTRKGRVLIAVLGKGRVLGCWSTLLDEPHLLLSSASCQRETKVVAMKGTDLRAIMLANRMLGFKILERLCFLLRDRIQGAYGAMERI